MYRIKEIQKELLHVVGWEQSYDPANAIEESLTQSIGGLYFQGAHPLCTIDNVRSIMPDSWGYQYPDWVQQQYAAGKKVKHNTKVWVAVVETETEPTDENKDWKVFNMVSDYLTKLTNDGIAKMVQTFIQIKGLDKETKSLLERTTFFDGSGRINAVTQNTGKMVGFEIDQVKSMGVTTKVERIGLQFNEPVKLNLYIFHSSQNNAVKTIELNYTPTNGSFQWFTIDEIYLPNGGQKTNVGGSWFICYNQNELPNGAEAINVSKDWSREPCGTCNIGNIESWRNLTKYIRVSPFMVPATNENELWNPQQMLYTNTQNYGMNVEISVGCDLTDFIIAQRQLFQTVIQRQVAVTVLRTLAMNPDVRVNRNQSNASKMEILYEIDGNTNGVRPGGLGYDLKKAYEAIRLDTQGIDRICLKCNNGGVKYKSIG